MNVFLAEIESHNSIYDALIITVTVILVAGKIIDNYINGKNKND